MSGSVAERFWAKVDVGAPDECWPWTGAVWGNGYGHFYCGGGRAQQRHATAHRVAYELTVGPVARELVVDHLCRNRLCCNPDHLEPVTHRENSRRGVNMGGDRGTPRDVATGRFRRAS